MSRPAPTIFALTLAATLAACQSAAPSPAPKSATTAAPIPNIVQGVCGDCHGVEPPFLSPNPEAAGFDAIANRAGLTRGTLADWLLDAHNYPELMEFELSREEAREVADYMATLQTKDYKPAP